MKELFIEFFRDASSYQSIDPTCFDLQDFTETWLEDNKQQLTLGGVIPMLPKITSNEFQNYLKRSGYERIDDELLQKGNDYYCVNNVYRHFLNLIEFGN